MEHQFNCTDRLWISQMDFVGQTEIDFLQRWSKNFIPAPSLLDRRNFEDDTEIEVEEEEEEPQPGPSRNINAPTNKGANRTLSKEERYKMEMDRIDALGDDFFGVPETVKKRKRREQNKLKAEEKERKKQNGEASDEDEEQDKTSPVKEVEEEEEEVVPPVNTQVAEKEQEKENKQQEVYLWKGANGQVEDQFGNVLNLDEVSDEDLMDTGSSSSDSAVETEDGDEEGEGDNTKFQSFMNCVKSYLGDIPFSGLNLNRQKEIKSSAETVPEKKVVSLASVNYDDEASENMDDGSSGSESDSETEDRMADLGFSPRKKNKNNNKNKNTEPTVVVIDSEVNKDVVGNNQVNADGDKPTDMGTVVVYVNQPQSQEAPDDPVIVHENLADNNALVPVPMDTTTSAPEEKKQEFVESLQKKRWQKKVEKERSDKIKVKQLKTLIGFDDKEHEFMMSQTEPILDEVKGLPYVDEPILKNGLMPIMAPPIPRDVLKASQALSVYVNFSSNPGEFQWKCMSVNEQMSSSLNHDLQTRKRLAAEKKYYESYCEKPEFVDDKDVIFSVNFYHSTSGTPGTPKPKEPELAISVNILGSQTLTDLRSKFYCKHDHIGELIEGNPFTSGGPTIGSDACLEALNKSMDKPCGILVGVTMYRNKASKETHDYAKELLKWSEGLGIFRKKLVGPFEMGDMETTKLVDLRFKHGFPYLFIHQGNCEHLVVFEKVRNVHQMDFLLKENFPTITKANFRTTYCQVDNTRIARYAVRNSKWFPQDPMLLCPECLAESFKGNERVDNFRLYPFLQISSLF